MLRFDYDRLREPCLLISGDFAADQISELQAAMLRENEIAGVMPAVLDADAETGRFLCYLQGRQPISRALGRSGLTLERYFSILYEVTGILASSRAHMLLERNFLLDEEVIFEKEGKPQLVYLPLTVPHTEDIGAALLKLAVRWTSYLQDETGRGVAELLALLQSPGCTAESVNRRLEQLLQAAKGQPVHESFHSPVDRMAWPEEYALYKEEPLTSAASEHLMEVPLHRAHASEVEAGRAHAAVEQSSPGLPAGGAGKPRVVSIQHKEMRGHSEADEKTAWWKQRESWVRLGLAAVTVVILWQIFAWKPSEMMLYGCLGVGSAVMLLLFGKLPWTRGNVVLAEQGEEEDWESFDAVLPEADYYEQLPNQTVVLKPEEAAEAEGGYAARAFPSVEPGAGEPATVLIAPEEWTSRPLLVLQQEAPHADVFHTIDKSGAVLGRSTDEADVRIDAPGVSSSHLEFQWQAEKGWSLQDLGSRNGTRVNGEWLVPYKPVPLQVGDRLELPGISCTVKDLNAGNRERYNEKEASE